MAVKGIIYHSLFTEGYSYGSPISFSSAYHSSVIWMSLWLCLLGLQKLTI